MRISILILTGLACAGFGQNARTFQAHKAFLHSMMFAPNGKHLFTFGRDGDLKVWETSGWKCKKTWTRLPSTTRLLMTRDRVLVTTARGGELRLWEPLTGKDLLKKKVVAELGVTAITPDGSILAYPGEDHRIHFVQVDGGREVQTLDFPRALQGNLRNAVCWLSLSFSPDGKQLLAGCTLRNPNLIKEGARRVHLWEWRKGKVLLSAGPGSGRAYGGVEQTFWGLGGRCFGFVDSTVEICSTITRRKLYPGLSAFRSGRQFLTMSVSGRLFAIFRWHPHQLDLYETVTGKAIRTWSSLKRGQVVAFSPHDAMMALGDDSGRVTLEPVFEQWQVPSKLTVREQSKVLWAALGSESARQAYEAQRQMLAFPGFMVPYLRTQLEQRDSPPSSKQIAQWLRDLDSRHFKKRQIALEGLKGAGDQATGALKQALRAKPSLEARRHIERLLRHIIEGSLSSTRLRVVRAITVLEHLGTKEAIALLEDLAKGSPGSEATQEAKSALTRIRRLRKP